MSGVAEEAAEFRQDSPFFGLARFRRFGDFGPAYEVIGTSGGKARVRVLDTDEEVELPLVEVSADRLA